MHAKRAKGNVKKPMINVCRLQRKQINTLQIVTINMNTVQNPRKYVSKDYKHAINR